MNNVFVMGGWPVGHEVGCYPRVENPLFINYHPGSGLPLMCVSSAKPELLTEKRRQIGIFCDVEKITFLLV